MNGDASLRLRYTDFLEETRRINRSILHNAEKKGRSEGIAIGRTEGICIGHDEAVKEMVLNMYHKGWDVDLIADCINITNWEVQKIINDE